MAQDVGVGSVLGLLLESLLMSWTRSWVLHAHLVFYGDPADVIFKHLENIFATHS